MSVTRAATAPRAARTGETSTAAAPAPTPTVRGSSKRTRSSFLITMRRTLPSSIRSRTLSMSWLPASLISWMASPARARASDARAEAPEEREEDSEEAEVFAMGVGEGEGRGAGAAERCAAGQARPKAPMVPDGGRWAELQEKREERRLLIRDEALDHGPSVAQERHDGSGGCVADAEPDDLRGRAEKEAPLVEIRVLRHEKETVLRCEAPQPLVRRGKEPDLPGMHRAGVHVGEESNEPERQVLVEQEPHAAAKSRRSRSAANARAARRSSMVRSGKSPRISSGVIPPARYSSTSVTVIRVPRIVGFPLRTAGSIVMRSW